MSRRRRVPGWPKQPLVYGDVLKLGVPFGGPYKKDYSIMGSILGSPYLGKLPYGLSYVSQSYIGQYDHNNPRE